jgi:hypothetical protein
MKQLLERRRRPALPGDPRKRRLAEARATGLKDVEKTARRHGVTREHPAVATAIAAVHTRTDATNLNADGSVGDVISSLDRDLLRARARTVGAVTSGLIACRAVKVSPTPIRPSGCSHIFGATEISFAILDERGNERCPLCVLAGLQHGTVFALIGVEALGTSGLESRLREAAATALARARELIDFIGR